MPIPTYDRCMLPLLQITADGQNHRISDAIDKLADHFQLTEEERQELLPSGRQTIFSNRVHWANTYLKKASLLKGVGRGLVQITPLGMEVLEKQPDRIDRDYLLRFEDFAEFYSHSTNQTDKSTQTSELVTDSEVEHTPVDLLNSSYQKLREQLAQDILESIVDCSPSFFEKLVVDLLLAMGYGKSVSEAGKTTRLSGDGGVDGIISEDKLGFDMVYIQAKKWSSDNPVGRPYVQAFAGTMMGQGVTKGTLITTSYFTSEAREYASGIKQLKIILIDGKRLAELMIDHNIGVSIEATYIIKGIDSDYFQPCL